MNNCVLHAKPREVYPVREPCKAIFLLAAAAVLAWLTASLPASAQSVSHLSITQPGGMP